MHVQAGAVIRGAKRIIIVQQHTISTGKVFNHQPIITYVHLYLSEIVKKPTKSDDLLCSQLTNTLMFEQQSWANLLWFGGFVAL